MATVSVECGDETCEYWDGACQAREVILRASPFYRPGFRWECLTYEEGEEEGEEEE